jgi:hypothetical protein
MTSPMLSDEMLNATVQQKLQYHRMRPAVFRDQHGRRWSAQVSTDTLSPCTPLTPVGWQAPYPMLMPDGKYLVMGGAFGELVIDYDRWLRDLFDGRRAYEQQVLEWARKLYGGAAMEMIRKGDPDLQRVAGPGPMNPEFVRAMKSGANKWVLGIRRPDGTPYPVPTWAAEHLWTLQVTETWDGSDVDTSVDASRYADAEDDALPEDAAATAARLAEQLRYSDAEEDADPGAAPAFQPMGRRRRSRHA